MGDPGKDRETLVEQTAAAFRARNPHGHVMSHPAWHDLDDAGRVEAFETAARLRRMEAALDEEGLSTTAKAVLARIRGAAGSEP
ncbi:MAG: hypothetical protein QM820_59045 [Minicystis sp.]